MRIFLVGNGPSLRHTPINDLDGEDLFVTNRYGLIANRFGFTVSPRFYAKLDHNTFDMSHVEDIAWASENCEHLYLWDRFRTGYPQGHPNYEDMPLGVGDIDNAIWLQHCQHGQYSWDNVKAAKSWHLPEICTAYGSMSIMLQVSVLLGYDEIYLLGCDLGYGQGAHYPISDYSIDPRDKNCANDVMLAIHEMAKRSSPVPIYNATIGGDLDVYPRVDLREVINGR